MGYFFLGLLMFMDLSVILADPQNKSAVRFMLIRLAISIGLLAVLVSMTRAGG
jgi:hypothetical protein